MKYAGEKYREAAYRNFDKWKEKPILFKVGIYYVNNGYI